MSCTARMGLESSTACVDSNFRVFGMQGIRVVDLSVCPFVPNAHTQTFGKLIFYLPEFSQHVHSIFQYSSVIDVFCKGWQAKF